MLRGGWPSGDGWPRRAFSAATSRHVDPDADYLESIGDDYRLYAFPEDGRSGTPRRVKKGACRRLPGRFQDGDDAEAHAAA